MFHIGTLIGAHALGHQAKNQKTRQHEIHRIMDAAVKAHEKGHQNGAHRHACIATQGKDAHVLRAVGIIA